MVICNTQVGFFLPFHCCGILNNLAMHRGGNGELRVGVRRFARQQSSMPSSVISSQSMHLGVLATASHAVSTQTRFVVYYKPRYNIFLGSEKLDLEFLIEFLKFANFFQDKSVHYRLEQVYRSCKQ